MKTNFKLILFLALIISYSCSEIKKNVSSEIRKNADTELYLNADQYRTYDSSTGKPFTGIGVRKGSNEYCTTIEIKYEDGYGIETKYIDSKGKIAAIFRCDKDCNPTGELYYDYNGNAITKEEFLKVRR
ncbi:hypothetical protein [uncultured Bacteroides sp.]|uniref:hypothetical protein n=1 Tax=uncultured Bacteroides sp. TaxID=162156 RepID=UPI002AA8FF4C|nr:hypothetical protein [uncultured Bacteroides sp.]